MTGNFPDIGKKRMGFFQSLEKSARAAFTLVELLVVIAILGVLAAILAPAIGAGFTAADSARCMSNLRQLHVANTLYASEHGRYVAAAPDIWDGGNLHRWHGVRAVSKGEPFKPENGPLAKYLGGDGAVRFCPALKHVADGFESGCGGYGYNYYGVGSRSYALGSQPGAAAGIAPSGIRHPAETLMFADTAYPEIHAGEKVLIEYSFAEPHWHLEDRRPVESYEAQPSIHFRHNGRANVVWCDGHVTRETMTFSQKAGGFEAAGIGWFGPKDNSLFDPF